MPYQRNQEIVEEILEVLRLIVSDGRLTFGDAIYIIEGLLQINWFTSDGAMISSYAISPSHKEDS